MDAPEHPLPENPRSENLEPAEPETTETYRDDRP